MPEGFPELLRVQHKGLEIRLHLIALNKLLPHEETVAEEVLNVVDSLISTKVMRHPILVDAKTAVVLDGTHRLEAARRLNFSWIPACLVDYNNPAIRVDRWYKIVLSSPIREVLELEFKRIGLAFESMAPHAALQRVEKGQLACAIVASYWAMGFESSGNVLEDYDRIRRVERSLLSLGARLADEEPERSIKQLREERVEAVLATPPISKQAVIEGALSRRLFPPRSTRHVVPGRLLKLEAPTDVLAERSLVEAAEQLSALVKERRLKLLPPRSKVGSRVYEEEVYVFE